MQTYRSSRYRWLYKSCDEGIKTNLAQNNNIPAPLAEVLIKRDVTTETKIKEYFDTPLNALINPFDMKDMKRGVERICSALKNNEHICVFGDYDVDGITATSLLYLFFKELGAQHLSYYIPNRLEEGYGMNMEAMHELALRKVNLIITVDCGISADLEVAKANELGMDVIITDHHQPAEESLPKAYAIINPMQADDTYPFKYLSGVGVAFKVCMGVRHALRNDTDWADKPLPNLKQYLDIVTLGTIADVVPLVDENRVFVVHGLKMLMQENLRPGLDELKKIAGYTDDMRISASHVGFGIAPRINAVGRMEDPDTGFQLLVTTSREKARRLAMEMDEKNKDRQKKEKEILEEVYQKIDNECLHEKYSGLVLYSKDWHSGILGIVASRVVDKYYRPTIVLTEENGLIKGSARSISSFHIYDGLRELSDILVSFGGHKYAAGIKIKPESVDELQNRFDLLVKNKLKEDEYTPEIVIDSFLDTSDITDVFMENLRRFEPYGNSNREPTFCMTGVEKYQEVSYVGKDGAHAKCYFTKDDLVYDAIGYNMSNYDEVFRNNRYFDILFTLSYNVYGKNKNLQMVLKDIKVRN